MGRRERDMARRVPILRHHHIGEGPGDAVDNGNDRLPSFTARLPPGRKQFWTSITSRADASSGLIDTAAQSFSEVRPRSRSRQAHDNLPPVQRGASPCEKVSQQIRSQRERKAGAGAGANPDRILGSDAPQETAS